MRPTPLHRLVAASVVAVTVLVGGLVAASLALGPGAFVQTYLDAVARGDARAALAMPGVDAAGADPRMLDSRALPGLDDARVVSSGATRDGVELVTAEWSAGGEHGVARFEVERAGATLGVFPRWSFAVSPTATLDLSVEGDVRYRVGGVDANTPGSGATVGMPARLALLVPGRYVVEHETRYLEAAPVEVVAQQPGEGIAAALAVAANQQFADAVDAEVRTYLDECATQTVLQPTGCPFGYQESNRIDSEPAWSIAEYPAIDLVPGEQMATWRVESAVAAAHLKVDVVSLFDGSREQVDEDVVFTLSLQVEFGERDALTIRPVASTSG